MVSELLSKPMPFGMGNPVWEASGCSSIFFLCKCFVLGRGIVGFANVTNFLVWFCNKVCSILVYCSCFFFFLGILRKCTKFLCIEVG